MAPLILSSFTRSSGDLSAVDTLIWRDSSSNPRYTNAHPKFDLKVFFGKFGKGLRRINVDMVNGSNDFIFILEALRAYNPQILEELVLRCDAMRELDDLLTRRHPSLHTLILDSTSVLQEHLQRIGENMTALRYFEFSCRTSSTAMVSKESIKNIRRIVKHNPKLHTFILRPAVPEKATTALDLFVLLFAFPKNKTPTLVGLEASCLSKLDCHSKIFRLLGKSVWESLYLDGDLIGLDEADPDLADTDFRTYYETSPNEQKLSLLMRFHYLLSRKPLNYSHYVRWAESLIIEITNLHASIGGVDSAVLIPTLMALGSNLLEFKSPDAAAVKELRAVSEKLMTKFDDPIFWLQCQCEFPEIDIPTIVPLFPAVLASFKWCQGGKVCLSEEQMKILHTLVQAHPPRIQSLLKDPSYDPVARLTTGETLASWLVREVVTFATSALMVPWAEYALESCAKSGVTLSWESTNIDYGFFRCLMESPSALSSMAIVFDRIDELLEPKYLELRTNASSIPRIKTLFEKHAAAWPDDAPIQETLAKLAAQLWREVLWEFSNEKINPKDHVQTLHYGDMRSAVLTLVQSFPAIPPFVVEFMKGKHPTLVQRDAAGIRAILRDLFPEGPEQHRDECAVM
jgi:hypothetical protein